MGAAFFPDLAQEEPRTSFDTDSVDALVDEMKAANVSTAARFQPA